MNSNPIRGALSQTIFPNFAARTTVSSVFLEVDKHCLVLKRGQKQDQSYTWCIPGGKQENNENPEEIAIRELREETSIDIQKEKLVYHGHRYARIPSWDYNLHLYSIELSNRPEVKCSNEHTEYMWISIYAIKQLSLIRGQDEAFDIVYADRLWQKIANTADQICTLNKTASITLKKGNQVLEFNAEKRLIFNLIGTSGSGKGTQGDMLQKIYEIPNISAGDIFRNEFRDETLLGKMVTLFDQHHYPAYLPDEIPIGMMAKRLSEKDCQLGFILDGFPRTEKQGEATRELFIRKGDIHIPLFMDVPEKDIWERLPGRSICNGCGHQVRKFDNNPSPGFCPIEAAQGKMIALEKRVEDVETPKIERRLKMFRENKEDILKSMEKRDPVFIFSLDNTISPFEVLHMLSEKIQQILDNVFKEQNI